MIKRIERPDWVYISAIAMTGEQMETHFCIGLDRWFDKTCEPINKMFSEGVEVSHSQYFNAWTEEPDAELDTHKALLINIQPIKKETAEDVLREIVKFVEVEKTKTSGYIRRVDVLENVLDRAKKVLEKTK